MKNRERSRNGYSLIELMMATALFMVITGAVFSLLYSAQSRYRAESGALSAFQQANIAMDQIVRDVHSSGYPSAEVFTSSQAASYPERLALPFAWSPGYASTPCTVGSNCTVPGSSDLILEVDPRNGTGVQWIRYSLSGTTLLRGMTTKTAAGDPVSTTDAQGMVTYLENVTNGSVAIFTYTFFDALAPHVPANIRQVNVCLMVQSAEADSQTGQRRVFTVTGQATRFNPNQ